jgi:TonB family protein
VAAICLPKFNSGNHFKPDLASKGRTKPLDYETFETRTPWPHNESSSFRTLGGSMTLRPSLQPRVPNDIPPQDGGTSNDRKNDFSPNLIDEIAHVARTLSNAGGGDLSLDLALDLVLNETVEQAREVTRGTGAAIALARNGEMICRATTGNAPNLGTRVDTSSGLSAACLDTGAIQQCADTELDPRVDREACRHLNLRSMVLIPIVENAARCGILEVFSSIPNNFSEQDVNLLRSLADKIVTAKDASATAVQASRPDAALLSTDSAAEKSPAELKKAADSQDVRGTASEHSVSEGTTKNEILTSALVVLVIAAAVLLGLVIGVRQTAKRAESRISTPKSESASHTVATSEEPVSHADSTASSLAAAPPQPHKSNPPVGGLIVTQNGRVIYRSEPSNSSATNGERSGSSGPNRLVHRVDPEYPEAAKSQRIEGPVVLDAQVLGDGSVGNIAIVAGHPLLAQAASQAVKQWKYQPYIVDGRPVERQERITVKFSLPSS